MLKGVFVDSREPEHIQKLTFGGVPCMVTALDAGDLWASCDDGELLVIERKTPNDLLASIGDNRLFLQTQKMRGRSAWAYVVITGMLTPSHDGKTIVNGKVTGWNWHSVQGALLSVQEAGINIAYCEHDNQYEQTVMQLAARNRGEKVLAPSVPARVMTAAETVLTGLPGIGLERAQDLLQYTNNSAAHAIAYLTWLDVFGEVAGIGPGIKQGVRRALGLADGESLTVWSDEAAKYMRQTLTEEARADVQKGLVTA